MPNPDASSTLLSAALSDNVSKPAGAGNNADPPPDIKTRTGPVASPSAVMTACAALTPAMSGTGWPAANTCAPVTSTAFS